ncbi:hypothetical protein SOVF_191150 [Spinacia oleracea]|nr:hypothetical protein SOVF_191150 [Spinacia oleracea]
MPDQAKIDIHMIRDCFVDKAIVFKADGGDNDYIVIAILGEYCSPVAYARTGDKTWSSIPASETYKSVVDVVQFGSQTLFLYQRGAVGCCDMSTMTVMEYLPQPQGILDNVGLFRLYLLDSFGDLIMVTRHKMEVLNEDPDPDAVEGWDLDVCYRTIEFKVYKLNFGNKIWEEVNDLGDVALFVGNNSSMAVDVSGTNNCKNNCIYFTDDEWQFWDGPTLYGGHDLGIFNIANQDFEILYEGDDIRSNFCTALWFVPQF